MPYDGFTTFNVSTQGAIAWVTFDYPPVNIQGLPMLADLNTLADQLEQDRDIKVVVFKSAHPEIFVAHVFGVLAGVDPASMQMAVIVGRKAGDVDARRINQRSPGVSTDTVVRCFWFRHGGFLRPRRTFPRKGGWAVSDRSLAGSGGTQLFW